MVHFLKVAALSLPLLALKSSVATATRYSVSIVAVAVRYSKSRGSASAATTVARNCPPLQILLCPKTVARFDDNLSLKY